MSKRALEDDYSADINEIVSLIKGSRKGRSVRQKTDRVVQASDHEEAPMQIWSASLPAPIRSYATALDAWNHPNAPVFRQALAMACDTSRSSVIMAARDSGHTWNANSSSIENMYTTSHGQRLQGDDGGTDPMDKLVPFFGIPNRPVARNPYNDVQQEIFDLPEAYPGNIRHVSQTLFYQLTKTDLTLLREGMPVVTNNSTASILMVQNIYDPTLLGRLPYESAPRLVVARRTQKEWKPTRFGLGCMSEWGFWNTEAGARDWLNKQDQIGHALTRTLALYAVVALLNCMKVPTRVDEMRRGPYDTMSWREVIQRELDAWNILARFDGLQAGADLALEELEARHVSASASKLMFVIPSGAEKFIVHTPERRDYQVTGIPKLTYDDPDKLRLRGVAHLHVSKPFMVSFGEVPIDPTYRARAIGYMWHFTGFPHCGDLKEIKEFSIAAGGVKAHFEEPNDDWHIMPHRHQFEHCGLYARPRETADGKGWIKGEEGTLGRALAAQVMGITSGVDRKFLSVARLLREGSNDGAARLDAVCRIAASTVSGHGDLTALVNDGTVVLTNSTHIKTWLEKVPVFNSDKGEKVENQNKQTGYLFFEWCYANGVPVPLKFSPIAPHVRYRVGQSILLVGGGECGVTMAGNPDTTVGMNPKTKIVSLAFSINLGAHVMHPEKVVVIPNSFVQRYISGCKFGAYMDPENKTMIQKYKDGAFKRDEMPCIFSILVPNSYTPSFAISRASSVHTKSTETTCATMQLYAELYGWRSQEYDAFSYHPKNPLQWESDLCFQQLQFRYALSPDGKCVEWGAVTQDKGHWQNNVTDANCLKYRTGRVAMPHGFIPDWQRAQHQRVVVR